MVFLLNLILKTSKSILIINFDHFAFDTFLLFRFSFHHGSRLRYSYFLDLLNFQLSYFLTHSFLMSCQIIINEGRQHQKQPCISHQVIKLYPLSITFRLPLPQNLNLFENKLFFI